MRSDLNVQEAANHNPCLFIHFGTTGGNNARDPIQSRGFSSILKSPGSFESHFILHFHFDIHLCNPHDSEV